MRPRKYALESLARLRAEKADEAARDLAAAIGEQDLAERRRLAAEESRAEQMASTRRVQDAETGALERGELCSADLARASAWQVRAVGERGALDRRVECAEAEVARAASKTDEARGELATRHADSQAVIADEKRWRERVRADAEAEDDEAASEAWRPAPGR